jgi:hypothetical protein
MSRRECLNRLALGVGGIALADLLARDATAAPVSASPSLPLTPPGPAALPGLPHFPAKAKRIIYLFQSGGPSQLDLYDHKPLLNARHGEQLPDSVRGSQRLTGMSGNQSSIPIAGSPFKFSRYGQSGAWISDLLPHTAKIADDLCVIRSMHTEAINHGPGVTFMQTGSQIPGRPSFGSWLDYGLGSANANLPSFVVLITKDKKANPSCHTFGAPASSPPSIRAFASAPAPTPSFTSTIPPAFRPKTVASPSTASANCTSTNSPAPPTPRSRRASRITRWRSTSRPAFPR